MAPKISQVTEILLWQHEQALMRLYEITLDPAVKAKPFVMGIDPGLKTGAVILTDKPEHYALLATVPGKAGMDRVPRMQLLYDIFDPERFWMQRFKRTGLVFMEDAAYSKGHGQVKLAEHRTAVLLAVAQKVGVERVQLVNPRTVRKAVFGKGTIKPSEVWGSALPVDCLDALATALYGTSSTGCWIRSTGG